MAGASGTKTKLPDESDMAKRKDDGKDGPQNRANVKYVALPLGLWKRFKKLADADERSISWVMRQAAKEYLEKHDPEEE